MGHYCVCVSLSNFSHVTTCDSAVSYCQILAMNLNLMNLVNITPVEHICEPKFIFTKPLAWLWSCSFLTEGSRQMVSHIVELRFS